MSLLLCACAFVSLCAVCRHRVQVSASSKLVPVAHAAEIRPGSRGNLLRQLLSANVDADLYGKEIVRAVINVSACGPACTHAHAHIHIHAKCDHLKGPGDRHAALSMLLLLLLPWLWRLKLMQVIALRVSPGQLSRCPRV